MALSMASCSSSGDSQLSPQFTYMSQMSVQPEDYNADFKQVDSIVRLKYSHIEAKNINMDSLYTTINQRVMQAQTPEAYGSLLQEYFAALRNDHSMALFNSYYLDFSVARVEDKILFSYVGMDSLKMQGVKRADEILAVGGVPVLEWLESKEKYRNASTQRGLKLYTTMSAIKNSYSPAKRTYTIMTEQGKKDITLSFCDANSQRTNNLETIASSTLTEQIGYIAINSMNDMEVTTKFAEALSSIKQLPYLIIDVRNNGGGYSNRSEEIAEYLIKEKQQASVSGDMLEPRDNRYTGKIYLLTHTTTASAAESFALDLKESANVTLVGVPTSGDTGNSPMVQATSYGTYFNIPTRKPVQVSPKGFPMEGIGIEPHHHIEQSLEDYINDVDTQLEYLVKMIQG